MTEAEINTDIRNIINAYCKQEECLDITIDLIKAATKKHMLRTIADKAYKTHNSAYFYDIEDALDE